jgi:hypothetical protein
MTVLALCAQGCDHGFHDEGDPDPLLDYDPPSDLSTPSQLDVLPQSAQAKLDVLWVIDASGSMAEERPKLLAALPSFMDDLLGSGFDWHVGVVTMGEGPSRPLGALVLSGGAAYLTPDTPDPVGALSQMAAEDDTAGPGGQGFLAALDALTMPTPELLARNGGFLRDSAELRVIVVSDQDDQSAPAVTRDQFVAAMQVLKPDPSTPVSFSAITGDAPGGCDAANSGAAYVAAADALDGAVGSVCDEDWTASMPSVAVQDGVFNTEFFLTQVPVPGTLSVWVTDGDLRYDGLDVAALAADGWSVAEACAQGLTNCFPYRYDLVRNVVVTSGFVPAPSTRVHARYDLLSTPE